MSSSEDRKPPFLLLVLHFKYAILQTAATRRSKRRGCRASFVSLVLSCPQRVMRCLRHSQLQYVFIGRRSKTCVITCVCVCVVADVRVDKCVFWSHAAQNWGLESDDSPLILDEVTWRADVTCPDTHSELRPHVTSPWCGFEREVPETNCHLGV